MRMDKRISVRLSDEEYALLSDKAKFCDMTVAEYIRAMAYSDSTPPPDYGMDKKQDIQNDNATLSVSSQIISDDSASLSRPTDITINIHFPSCQSVTIQEAQQSHGNH